VNHDELMAKMLEDELADGIALGELRKMSVADYAKARGIRPQLIHYYIRTGKILPTWCECGRKCVDVREADLFFEKKDGNPMDKDEEDVQQPD
jgi:hypothetical protein